MRVGRGDWTRDCAHLSPATLTNLESQNCTRTTAACSSWIFKIWLKWVWIWGSCRIHMTLVSHACRKTTVASSSVQKHREWVSREGLETSMISNSLLCFLSAHNLKQRTNTNHTQNTHTWPNTVSLAFSHTDCSLAIPPTLASKCSGQAIHPSLCVHCWCLHTLDCNHPS